MLSTQDLYQIFLEYPGISTDSRNVRKDTIFVALKGDRFDGNRYAHQALENGAAVALVDDPAVAVSDRYLLTDDCLETLQRLATWHRRQFAVPVIGITGSNGKTTTKELTRDVLARHYKVHATTGNYNNHIGVPLTLLAMPSDTGIAVIEMGANAQGEIHLLSTLAEPDYGVITNIGKAHLEGFGGVEGVKKGKSELYRFLHAHGGTVFVNEDERFLRDLIPPDTATISYGSADEPFSDSKAIGIRKVMNGERVGFSFIDGEGQLQEGFTELHGQFNFGNVATAIAVGLHFNVPGPDILHALTSYRPDMMRSQIIERNGIRILLDAYNANPSSMKGALTSFPGFQGTSPRIAILGDMLELGTESRKEHRSILELAKDSGIDQLILVGPEFAAADFEGRGLHFSDVYQVISWWRSASIAEATILIKGSRKWQLEQFTRNTDTSL